MRSVRRSYEANRIFDNSLHLGNLKRGEGLVAGLEVEYLSVSSFVKNARTEHLTARIVTDKKHFIGVRDNEGLSVCLLVLKLEVSVYTSRYGVCGIDHPKDLGVSAFSPGKVTGCSHKCLEGL